MFLIGFICYSQLLNAIQLGRRRRWENTLMNSEKIIEEVSKIDFLYYSWASAPKRMINDSPC